MEEYKPLISEQSFLQALAEGGAVVIECIESAVKKQNHWCGEWKVHVKRGNVLATLSVQRTMRPLLIKTDSGIATFAVKLGFRSVNYPVYKGDTVVWTSANASESSGKPPESSS